MALQPNCADVLHQILLCIRCHTVQSSGTATYYSLVHHMELDNLSMLWCRAINSDHVWHYLYCGIL